MPELKGKVLKAVRTGDGDSGRVVGNSLRSLRELAGLTQKQMAERLQIGQASISKIEHRGDIHIQSLQRYVEALGAKLRIEAAFPPTEQVATRFNLIFESDTPDDDQLVFPLFGDELFRKQWDVVLSIRPPYSDRILEGKKTVELRRRFPVSAPRGAIAYIYSTSPVRAMVGRAEISEVVKLPVPEIWRRYRKCAHITKPDFESYFSGLNEGFVLEFANVQPFPRPIELAELRKRFGFEPPQSFLYATTILRRAIQDEFPNLPD